MCGMAHSSCSGGRERGADGSVLYQDIDLSVKSEGNVALSELFPKYELVHLETTDSCLVNPQFKMKYLKRDGVYYVRSNNDVLIFDSAGKFRNAISRQGGGPQEYTDMLDFDVVDTPAGPEILVSTLEGLCRYDAMTGKFREKVNLPFYPRQIKYVNDSTILVNTNRDPSFRVVRPDGSERKGMISLDYPNSGGGDVQFRNVGDLVAYQISNADNAVVYDSSADTLGIKQVVPLIPDLLTMADNTEYYKNFDQSDPSAYYKALRENKILFDGVFSGGGSKISTTKCPDGQWRVTFVGADGKSRGYVFWPEEKSQIVNDCFDPEEYTPRFFATAFSCESDDSMMFVLFSDSDDNPVLLNVYELSDFEK